MKMFLLVPLVRLVTDIFHDVGDIYHVQKTRQTSVRNGVLETRVSTGVDKDRDIPVVVVALSTSETGSDKGEILINLFFFRLTSTRCSRVQKLVNYKFLGFSWYSQNETLSPKHRYFAEKREQLIDDVVVFVAFYLFLLFANFSTFKIF